MGKKNILGKTKELTEGSPVSSQWGPTGLEEFFAEERYKIYAKMLAGIQPVDRMRETAARVK